VAQRLLFALPQQEDFLGRGWRDCAPRAAGAATRRACGVGARDRARTSA